MTSPSAPPTGAGLPSQSPEDILREAEEAQRRLEAAEERELQEALTGREARIAQLKQTHAQIASCSEALIRTETKLAEIKRRRGKVAPELEDACRTVRDQLQQVIDLEKSLTGEVLAAESHPEVIGRLHENALKEEAGREEAKDICGKAIALKRRVNDIGSGWSQLGRELDDAEEACKTDIVWRKIEDLFRQLDDKTREALNERFNITKDSLWTYHRFDTEGQEKFLQRIQDTATEALGKTGFLDGKAKRFLRAVLLIITPAVLEYAKKADVFLKQYHDWERTGRIEVVAEANALMYTRGCTESQLEKILGADLYAWLSRAADRNSNFLRLGRERLPKPS